MCTVCGCGTGDAVIEGADHRHDHPPHSPDGAAGDSRLIRLEQDILAKNDRYAEANRRFLQSRGVFAVNLMSSPGSGKTTLLIETLRRLDGRLACAVIEGDQQTSADADRIRATGTPALQINTGKGCHLDGHMVGHALERLQPSNGSILFIENVGNLVCPAAFDLGEVCRAVIFSVTEGEDKPLKYPDIFAAADLVVISKADLLPYLAFDMDAAVANTRRVNPDAAIAKVSATSGQGMEGWIRWIGACRADMFKAPAMAEA